MLLRGHRATARVEARVVAAVVALALVATVVVAPTVSAAEEASSPAGRADELVEAAGFNPTVVPQLVDVSTELETWTVELEETVELHRASIADLQEQHRPLEMEIVWLENRVATLTTSVDGESLTEEVVAARNEIPSIEGALEELQLRTGELQLEVAVAQEELALALELVMVAWSLRQDVAQQFATIAEMESADLSRWPDILKDRVQRALEDAQQVAEEQIEEAAIEADADAALQERSIQAAEPAETPVMVWPAIGAVNSGYGMRVHPVWGSRRMHTGIDIDAAWGDDVVATEAGVVVRAGWNGGYGNTVEVDHGNGLTTLYAHLSELHVVLDDVVEQGDVVGLIGATGVATDAHLHFEVRTYGQDVDPLLYIP